MGLFDNLFKKEKLTIVDSDFGKLISLKIKKEIVYWGFKINFLNTEIDVFINGTKENVSEIQKKILLNALKNENIIQIESEIALKEEFANADMEFNSIDKDFEISCISLNLEGFELTFQQLNEPNYSFNVYFINNKQQGVSIDS